MIRLRISAFPSQFGCIPREKTSYSSNRQCTNYLPIRSPLLLAIVGYCIFTSVMGRRIKPHPRKHLLLHSIGKCRIRDEVGVCSRCFPAPFRECGHDLFHHAALVRHFDVLQSIVQYENQYRSYIYQ